jgi:hypothetical protein
MACQRAGSSSPVRNLTDKSRKYSTLRADNPQRVSVASRMRATRSGCTVPQAFSTRPQMVWAAATEICCPTMERASVRYGSLRGTRCKGPQARMMPPSTRSRRASERRACAQNSGGPAWADGADGSIAPAGGVGPAGGSGMAVAVGSGIGTREGHAHESTAAPVAG